MGDTKRDGWDKAAIILQPVGGLLTALAVAAVGFFASSFLERRQAIDTNVRLYSELMSKREEAESALRKDMFVSIIQSFLQPALASLDTKVLNLELLVYNFHESLNLKPLFTHLKGQVAGSRDGAKQEYMERLDKAAREVVRKQMLVLEGAGKKFDRTIDLETLWKTPGGIPLEEATLTLENIKRDFRIIVLYADSKAKELKIRLEIRTHKEPPAGVETNVVEFGVGFFDFPIIDNTRLSHDQRCAIVLTAFGESSADITGIYFPGAYASLKEKPYYQEVVQNLLKANQFLGESKAR
ncbi:MAG: hypothetical protein L0Y78_02175 [candidate division NC10 bacterium]|nr:hypothetical protein [candidate division NC10 bacterium]